MDQELSAQDLRDAWPALSSEERMEGFRALGAENAEVFLGALPASDRAKMLGAMKNGERKLWFRSLAPDDAADVIQQVPEGLRSSFLALLEDPFRREVQSLLAYAEDHAGGLMNPRFARLRPDMSAEDAILYVRKQANDKVETLYYGYVLDQGQHLLGVVSYRDLFTAPASSRIDSIMKTRIVTVPEQMDQEAVARLMADHNLKAVPVLDDQGHMRGIVTIDDIVDVVQREATEDIHKLGGMEALDTPYLQTGLGQMVRKRAGWLAALFLGEMLTASAMSHYENEIARAVVLALFVPLITSSGGNSGSQATSLIIRAMALGEVTIRDWWRILHREIRSGLLLGLILAAIGMVRILLWQALFHTYGQHYFRVALSVSISLVGIVTWGTIAGSMLPFVIRRLGFDPASASAPFVATLVDVSGLLIYFNVAQAMLRGTLL
jgi:magnesium transporter